jgi:hypothetical protein
MGSYAIAGIALRNTQTPPPRFDADTIGGAKEANVFSTSFSNIFNVSGFHRLLF